MTEAKQNIPHFYLRRELDLRATLAAKKRENIPITALLLGGCRQTIVVSPG